MRTIINRILFLSGGVQQHNDHREEPDSAGNFVYIDFYFTLNKQLNQFY